MSELLKRYWMVLVAGLLAIWTAYALINPATHLEGAYQRQADADAAYYAEKAQREYSWDCVSLSSTARDKCRYDKAEAAREGQHDAADLEAQLVTSLWTRQMGIAAILGVALSLVGVVLVWITFRATREANEIAQGVAAAELRAWVSIELVPTHFRVTERSILFDYRVVSKNIGHTMAQGLEPNFTGFFVKERTDTEVDEAYAQWAQPQPGDIKAHRTIMPGEQYTGWGSTSAARRVVHWFGEEGARRCHLIVVASVFYWSALDNKWHRTDRSFILGTKGDGFLDDQSLPESLECDWKDGDLSNLVVAKYRSGQTT